MNHTNVSHTELDVENGFLHVESTRVDPQTEIGPSIRLVKRVQDQALPIRSVFFSDKLFSTSQSCIYASPGSNNKQRYEGENISYISSFDGSL